MIGAGTFINPILKLVTTVAILGAVYVFIVKPTLETTENISNRAFDASEQIRQEVQDDIDRSLLGVPGSSSSDFEVKIPKSAAKAQKLGDCVRGAVGNVDGIQKCMNRFSP